MRLKPLLTELIAALIEDLSALSPYAMAEMAEYGKVGGYAPAYRELKRDALGCFQLCQHLFPGAPMITAQSLPALVPNRIMSESFFEDERDQLIRGLGSLARALDGVSPSAFAEGEIAMSPEMREALLWLLDRAGIDANPNSPRDAITAPSRGGDIFVSSRLPRRLGDQISDVLARAGLTPVRPSGGPIEPLIRRCVGGIFGVLVDPNEGLRATREAPARRPLDPTRYDPELADDFAEISVADHSLNHNVMIVTREQAVGMLPTELRKMPLLTVKSAFMNPHELSMFSSLAAKTPWLRAPAA